jgi:multidrug transporter EmrE-like cation transporter
MTVTALAGRVIFRERIGARKLAGFVLGIAAITVIGIF